MSEQISTHESARGLVAQTLARSTPPARVADHVYDPTQPEGKLRISWFDGASQHLAVLRYRLPASVQQLRHDAAQLRDGVSHAHLRQANV